MSCVLFSFGRSVVSGLTTTSKYLTYCQARCYRGRKVWKDVDPLKVSKGVTRKKAADLENEFGIKDPNTLRNKDNVGLDYYMEALGITPEDIRKGNLEDFDFDEEQLEDIALDPQSSNLIEMAKEEVRINKRRGKVSMLRRKYFKEPPETNLLTWAAKEQIKFLHQINPKEWTPEKLAESFPISVEGVKKLLRNNFVPEGPEGIRKHDMAVIQNWKNLKNNEGYVSPITRQLWLEGKISPEHACGIEGLPAPESRPYVPKHKLLPKPTKTEFVSIVKPYLESKGLIEQKTQQAELKMTDADQQLQISKEIMDQDVMSASYLDPKGERMGLYMTQEQFKQQNEKFWWKKKATAAAPQKSNVQAKTDFIGPNMNYDDEDEIVPKYYDDFVELNVDVSKENKGKEAYMYTDKHGYQRPFGKADPIPMKIKVPKNKSGKERLYQVGDCFYDDDGEFLYRVPIK